MKRLFVLMFLVLSASTALAFDGGDAVKRPPQAAVIAGQLQISANNLEHLPLPLGNGCMSTSL